MSREIKLISIFIFLILICAGAGLYLFVAFHYGHLWTLFLNSALLFTAFVSPAICYGYSGANEALLLHNTNMSEHSFLNCRDLGYVFAATLFLLTFVFPIVAWYSSETVSMGVVLVEFLANVAFSWAYVLWIRIFIY